MKKLIIAFVALFCMTVSTSAMGYEQAREQALFLTDKMAYELNLTEDQYEAAYEVNLDYLMGVNGYDDVYGTYWTRRNLDLSYILMDWQYQAFVNATYFYRPLWWEGGYWHFGIYARYPHRDYFYFGRPAFYASYRGGHSWHMNGDRSWYHGRDFGGPGPQGGRQNGMRDGFQRGDYQHGRNMGQGNRSIGQNNGTPQRNNSFGNGTRPNTSRSTTGNRNGATQSGNVSRQTNNSAGTSRSNSSFGGQRSSISRQSSTRTTVTQPQSQSSRSSFGGSRSASSSSSVNTRSTTVQPRQSFTPRQSSSSVARPSSSSVARPSSSFGGSRSSSHSVASPSRSAAGSSHSAGGGSRSGGSFGGRR